MNWRPLPSFFEQGPETPDVRLLVDGSEVLGFYDEDCHCWREAVDDEEVKPTAWQPLN